MPIPIIGGFPVQTVRTPEGWQSYTINPSIVDAITLDQRQATQNSGNSFVPTGVSATAHPLKIKMPSRLKFFSYWAVDPPGAGESIAIRLFRFLTGDGLQQVTNTFTLNAGNFISNVQVDLSANLIPGIVWDPLDVLACSYVQGGVQGLDPLIVSWSFEPETSASVPADPEVLPTIIPAVWPPV